MTISLEFMDWVKIAGIMVTVIGNGAWIYFSVKSLKEEMKDTNERISAFQQVIEKKINEIEKELRYEIAEKVDKRQYYDDIGGWRSDIRELRMTVLDIVKEMRK